MPPCCFNATTLNEQLIQNATKGYEKILGDQLRKDPTLLIIDARFARTNVIERKAAYPAVCTNFFKNLFLGIILYWYQVASINNLLTKKDKKDRCQLAVSPALKAYPSLAYQLAFTIGNPYAEIYSKYENLTSLLIIILFC